MSAMLCLYKEEPNYLKPISSRSCESPSHYYYHLPHLCLLIARFICFNYISFSARHALQC